MTYNKGWFSIRISLNSPWVKWTRITYASSRCNKISIGNPDIISWKYLIKVFKNLSANKLIITINNDKNFIRFAMLLRYFIQIRHSHTPFGIDDNFQFLFRDMFLFGPFLHFRPSLIFGSVINKYYMIIIVFLLQNRFHIFYVSLVYNILIAWNHNTDGHLLIFWYLIFLFKISPFFNRHLTTSI